MFVLLGASKKFELSEELLDLCHMKGTVKGEDILREVKETVITVDLSEDKSVALQLIELLLSFAGAKDLCLCSKTLLVMLYFHILV